MLVQHILRKRNELSSKDLICSESIIVIYGINKKTIQIWKKFSPKLVTELGMVMEVKLLQSSKQ